MPSPTFFEEDCSFYICVSCLTVKQKAYPFYRYAYYNVHIDMLKNYVNLSLSILKNSSFAAVSCRGMLTDAEHSVQ